MSALRDLRYALEYALARALFGIIRTMPEEASRRLVRGLAHIWYLGSRGRRRIALENLALAHGLPAGLDAQALVHKNFLHLAENLREFVLLGIPGYARRELQITCAGMENLQAALAKGRGVLLLGGHMGNWEAMGAAFTDQGFALAVVARPVRNPRVNGLLVRTRETGGMRVIPSRNAVKQILRALAGGAVVPILLDHNTSRREAVFIPFLGRTAAVNTGLALLARKTGAPVVPAFTWRVAPGRHEVNFYPEIPTERTDDAIHDTLVNTTRYTAMIEQVVRAHPEQWLWIHRRWKTRPEGEAASAAPGLRSESSTAAVR